MHHRSARFRSEPDRLPQFAQLLRTFEELPVVYSRKSLSIPRSPQVATKHLKPQRPLHPAHADGRCCKTPGHQLCRIDSQLAFGGIKLQFNRARSTVAGSWLSGISIMVVIPLLPLRECQFHNLPSGYDPVRNMGVRINHARRNHQTRRIHTSFASPRS